MIAMGEEVLIDEREKAIRAAAVIDTDGCIYIRKAKCVVTCIVRMTDGAIPIWLKQEYGGSICFRQPKLSQGVASRRPEWVWTIAAQLAEDFLNSILPFLLVKRRQADCALMLRKLQGREFKTKLLEVKREQWEPYYHHMRELNSPGFCL